MNKKRSPSFIDLTGQVFSRWTVLKCDLTSPGTRLRWICKCNCGTIRSISGYTLRKKQTKSCGCYNDEKRKEIKKYLAGLLFDRLIVLDDHFNRKSVTFWKCKCSCGKTKFISSSALLSGKTRSCGCLVIDNLTSHGMSNTRIYHIWDSIKQRCTNSNSKNYSRYGGRGIKLCDQWLSFEGFYKDNGESYNKHVEEFGEKNTSIDRIDPNGNYEPGNVRWATNKEQSRNRTNTSKTVDYDAHLYWKGKLLHIVYHTLFRNKTTESLVFEKYVGCTVEFFKQYIRSKFIEGMKWDNYGNGLGKWNFDHTKRIREFDLSKEKDRLECFHFSNMQPMWWKDNMEKH